MVRMISRTSRPAGWLAGHHPVARIDPQRRAGQRRGGHDRPGREPGGQHRGQGQQAGRGLFGEPGWGCGRVGVGPERDVAAEVVADEPEQRQGHPEQPGQAQVDRRAQPLVLAGPDPEPADDHGPDVTW
jgi:hypothetical protein